jgi:hypothetical protein
MTSRLAPREEAAPWGLMTNLDLYRCKPYDPDQLAQFSKGYFEAEAIKVRFVERM